MHRGAIRPRRQLHFHRCQIQGMAQGNQVMGLLGRHDAGDTGGSQHVALGCSPSMIIRRVSGAMRMVASARASRSVTALLVTSTIRASPLSSRWVNLLTLYSPLVVDLSLFNHCRTG